MRTALKTLTTQLKREHHLAFDDFEIEQTIQNLINNQQTPTSGYKIEWLNSLITKFSSTHNYATTRALKRVL